MGTKERILEAAIDLFSERGYGDVGIRDIARAVGIKESSLYNHFAGKQQLFEAILEELQRHLGAVTPSEEQAAVAMAHISLEQLQEISSLNARMYFGDERLLKMWRILSLERLKNPAVQELYQKLLIDDPLHYHTALFTMLMEAGSMPRMDPAALATAFYGPVYLTYVRHIENNRSPRPLDDGVVLGKIASHMAMMDILLGSHQRITEREKEHERQE